MIKNKLSKDTQRLLDQGYDEIYLLLAQKKYEFDMSIKEFNNRLHNIESIVTHLKGNHMTTLAKDIKRLKNEVKQLREYIDGTKR